MTTGRINQVTTLLSSQSARARPVALLQPCVRARTSSTLTLCVCVAVRIHYGRKRRTRRCFSRPRRPREDVWPSIRLPFHITVMQSPSQEKSRARTCVARSPSDLGQLMLQVLSGSRRPRPTTTRQLLATGTWLVRVTHSVKCVHGSARESSQPAATVSPPDDASSGPGVRPLHVGRCYQASLLRGPATRSVSCQAAPRSQSRLRPPKAGRPC
jgi:hypothetical protein